MSQRQNIKNKVTCPYFHNVTYAGRGSLSGVECAPLSDNLGFDVRVFQHIKKSELRNFMEIFCMDMWDTCPYAQIKMTTSNDETCHNDIGTSERRWKADHRGGRK